ncbi:hypothetical protein F4557_004179 [Actinomadura catellatispora]|uniref:Uncharacterized protein n=1 Tax=Actinomadura livida TaxID=79909 RepID=A0A7W7MYD0_9ACTN|nr:hypothetical protein [Actinomadura catellatispora]GGU34918.1 hypothetical protein GCM10010208_69490 [Actinomadura livida]
MTVSLQRLCNVWRVRIEVFDVVRTMVAPGPTHTFASARPPVSVAPAARVSFVRNLARLHCGSER